MHRGFQCLLLRLFFIALLTSTYFPSLTGEQAGTPIVVAFGAIRVGIPYLAEGMFA